jgi:hypothetical protein
VPCRQWALHDGDAEDLFQETVLLMRSESDTFTQGTIAWDGSSGAIVPLPNHQQGRPPGNDYR